MLCGAARGWEAEDGEESRGDVENLKEPKALSEMLTELGKAVPEIEGPARRRARSVLAAKMLEAGAGKKKVVAVVGAATCRA